MPYVLGKSVAHLYLGTLHLMGPLHAMNKIKDLMEVARRIMRLVLWWISCDFRGMGSYGSSGGNYFIDSTNNNPPICMFHHTHSEEVVSSVGVQTEC